MILNVCWCWGRSSWWFTLSNISCPLWRASKISHLKFYVARLFANLLNECKITADASCRNLCMYVDICRMTETDNHGGRTIALLFYNNRCFSCYNSTLILIIILMSVKALVFKRGRGQLKLPGLFVFSEPPAEAPLAHSPSIWAAGLHFCKVWFWFSEDQRDKGFTVKD